MRYYWYKDTETSYKLILAVDWFTSEDDWYQRYMFERPRYDAETMERYRIKNLNRHRWFNLVINVFNYKLHLEFKRNRVGNRYYGRFIADGPKKSPRKLKKAAQ